MSTSLQLSKMKYAFNETMFQSQTVETIRLVTRRVEYISGNYLQFANRGVVETSFPLCLLVKVVDCFMGEKCFVVEGV